MNAIKVRMWSIQNNRLTGVVKEWHKNDGGRVMKTICTSPIYRQMGNFITTQNGYYELDGPSRMTLRVVAIKEI